MKSNSPENPPGKPMVGWYDPSVFVLTGIESLISSLFGERSDFRQLQALVTQAVEADQVYQDDKGALQMPAEQFYYDFRYHYKLRAEPNIDDSGHQDWYERDNQGHYIIDSTRPREEIWLDYISDTGDGWNPTYAVAYYATLPELAVDADETLKTTRRGDILIFGGDQVYPAAKREPYVERLVAPFETAFKVSDKPHPFLFATPGNHDWYDSLVSFSRLFASRDWFGGWLTRQTRSYFALRLPHNWWFIAVDVQLSSDIDGAQMRFFKRLTKEMEPGDRIILGLAEPHWIHNRFRPQSELKYADSYLRELEENVFSRHATVRVFLAGDLHHYRRHESVDGRTHKITAGGGGAFLHPTHSGRLGKQIKEFTETNRDGSKTVFKQAKTTFPDEAVSRRLCWGNLAFLKTNWRFGLLTAGLYWMTSWVFVPIATRTLAPFHFGNVFSALFPNPAVAFWLALTIIAMIAFTNTHSRVYRIIAGSLHGSAHFLAAVTLSFLSVWTVRNISIAIKPALHDFYFTQCTWAVCGTFSTPIRLLAKHISIASLVVFGGFVVGPILMGLYLLPSLNIFGRHYNEAFASLRCEDWKHFLRLRVEQSGDLHIYPIGIERVPRKWRRRNGDDRHPTAKLVPEKEQYPPRLIEQPICISK
jgi:calcineurin-like phosphoesterase family protein